MKPIINLDGIHATYRLTVLKTIRNNAISTIVFFLSIIIVFVAGIAEVFFVVVPAFAVMLYTAVYSFFKRSAFRIPNVVVSPELNKFLAENRNTIDTEHLRVMRGEIESAYYSFNPENETERVLTLIFKESGFQYIFWDQKLKVIFSFQSLEVCEYQEIYEWPENNPKDIEIGVRRDSQLLNPE